MKQQYVVAKAADIPPGTHQLLEAGGKKIGVYNIGGEYFALRNVCPHQGAELCKGLTTAYVGSDGPGNFDFQREGEILRCPWHQWEFDIKTGIMVHDPAMRTKCYEVTVETFDVSIEDEQVVVHM
jgi:nitrite reductase (NADH) small subunit